MNVLSLFDSMSCGQLALRRARISYNEYYASEIEIDAIQIARHNFPSTRHVGCVKRVSASSLPQIDLLLGGSPCQGFSFAGKQLNFDDPRSVLFFEYVRLLQECRPRWFLLENVLMQKWCEDIITETLGVKPIFICSSSITAQVRKRLYWTNIPIKPLLPMLKTQVLADILEGDRPDSFYQWIPQEHIKMPRPAGSGLTAAIRYQRYAKYEGDKLFSNKRGQQLTLYPITSKAPCLTTKSDWPKIVLPCGRARLATRREHERLQGVPDNYTNPVGLSAAKKALGNGWTVPVIAHILKGIKTNN